MRNDKIIGALIGLVGAAGNSGWTEKTDQMIASALLQEVHSFPTRRSSDHRKSVV